MNVRLVFVVALALFAASGPAPSVAVADDAPAITNVTVFRSAGAFAGQRGPFAEQSAESDIRQQTESGFDGNGTAHVDTTTNVFAQPNSLSVTGDGVAELTVTAATVPPASSTVNVTVDFTTTVPTDYSFKGGVSATNLALPSNDVASCTLTGPGLSLGFGKMGPGGPWVFAGEFRRNPLPPGTYELTVVLQTQTVNPNVKQSTSFSSLDLSVTAFAPTKLGRYIGLCRAAVGTAPSDTTEGAVSVTVKAVKSKSQFAAKILLGPNALATAGTVDGNGRFLGKDGSPALVLNRPGKPNLTLTLIGNGALNEITGTLVEAGTNATSTVDLDLAVYTGKKNPPAPFLNPPASLVGNFTIIFPPTAPAGQVLTPSITIDKYPQGTGWANMTLDKNGNVKLKGKLADGTAIGGAGTLSKVNHLPFYVLLYGKAGSISGNVVFDNLGPCRLSASLRWFNPGSARADFYPAGWPTGIVTDLMGGKYAPLMGGGPIPEIPTTAGAASIVLSDPVVAAPDTVSATIDAAGKVSIVGDNSALKLTVKLDAKTGAMTGSFAHDGTKKKTTFSGVIVQDLAQAFGFFLNAPESGGVTIQ